MGEVEVDEARRVIAAAVAMAVAMVLAVVIVAADAAVVACTDAFAVPVVAAAAAGTWPVVGSAADNCLVLGPGIGSDTAAGLG